MENELSQSELAAEVAAGYNDTAETIPDQSEEITGDGQEVQNDDPWANVPEVVKMQFEELKGKAGLVDKLEARLRKSEGHIGDLIKRIKSEPTAEQLAALRQKQEARAKADEEMAKLEEVDPDIAAAIKTTRSQITEQFAGLPDVGKLVAEVEGRVSQGLATTRQEIQNEVVDVFHPGWVDEVKTQTFNSWLGSQPQDVASLAASTKAKDAVALLNKYNDFKTWMSDLPEADKKSDIAVLLKSYTKPKENPAQTRLSRAAATPKVNAISRPKGAANLTPEEQRAFDIQAGYNDE